MTRRLPACMFAALAVATPLKAAAEVSALFPVAAVSDARLAEISGTASPYALLSHGSLVRLTEAQARSDFRVGSTVAALEMDAWWGSIGSELIANAVRNRF